MDINLSGAFYCARAAARPMVEQKSGVHPEHRLRVGLPRRTGLLHVRLRQGRRGPVDALAGDDAAAAQHPRRRHRARVHRADAAENDEERAPQAERGKFIPVGRIGQAVEMGPLAVLLVSDAISYMSGETVALDGGGLAGGAAPWGFEPASVPDWRRTDVAVDGFDLTGKRALVVGAETRVGRAIAGALAEAGARLALASGPDTSGSGDEVAALPERLGSDLGRDTDHLTISGAADDLVRATVEELGGLDIVVNAADLKVAGPFEQMSDLPGIGWWRST